MIKLQRSKSLVCTDLPGHFPYTSSNCNNYIFVLYDFDSNNILGKPIKLHNADELVRGYKMCYNKLREGNITPILHRLDNEVNDKLFEAIRNNNCNYQLVTAYEYCPKLSKRAIQTYKNILFLFCLELMLNSMHIYGVNYCGK